MINLAALAAGSRAEQRTAEYRITKFEGLNRCTLSIVYMVVDRIPLKSIDITKTNCIKAFIRVSQIGIGYMIEHN